MKAVKIEDGILMYWRWSIGWNFHGTRSVKTFGLALSFADDRFLVLIGPFTLIWLFDG